MHFARNTNTNANTKYTCDTGQTRNKLLEQWMHLTNHTAGHSRPGTRKCISYLERREHSEVPARECSRECTPQCANAIVNGGVVLCARCREGRVRRPGEQQRAFGSLGL